MGCDIHPCVEVKQEDGSWKAIPDPKPPEWVKKPNYEWDFGRSYTCFSVLANVRNHYEMKPIAELRGLPEDATEETRKEVDDGLHSVSWLSLPEILSYDWDQVVRMEGWVGPEEFKRYMERGAPESYCRGVGGGNVAHVSNSDMRRIVQNGPYPWEKDKSFYTLLHWEEKYRDVCGNLFAMLDEVKKLGDPERIRIVFGFDS